MGSGVSTELPSGIKSACHVLKVQDNSPGEKAGLKPFFDFIISINDEILTNDNIKDILSKYANNNVSMKVFSIKTLSLRDVTLNLSTEWGGVGILGVSIRYCSVEGAEKNIWHVLDVHPKSPAAFARLNSHTDYIIGSDVLLDDESSFYQFIEENDGKVVKLYVYDSVKDDCREVSITPNSNWGGAGLLGCDIGYGYLHRIPAKINDVSENDREPKKKIETQNFDISANHEPEASTNENVCVSKFESHHVEAENPNDPTPIPDPSNIFDSQMSNIALPGMPPLNVPLNSIQGIPSQEPVGINNNDQYYNTTQYNLPPVHVPQLQNVPIPSYNNTAPMQNTEFALQYNPYNMNNIYNSMPPLMNQNYSQNCGEKFNQSYSSSQIPMPNFSETPQYTPTPQFSYYNVNQNNKDANHTMPPFNYQENLGV